MKSTIMMNEEFSEILKFKFVAENNLVLKSSTIDTLLQTGTQDNVHIPGAELYKDDNPHIFIHKNRCDTIIAHQCINVGITMTLTTVNST